MLGVVLARAGGRPLGELLSDRLFDPLGMTDTAFGAPSDRLERRGLSEGPVTPGVTPLSISCWRTQPRTDSTP